MREKPLCRQKKIVAKTNLFIVEQLDLQFSNGQQRIYERIGGYGKGAVLIVALTANGTLLLTREYAAGTDAYELAFPKGLIEQNETSLAAANRELQEEAGFGAKRLDLIRSMSIAPTYLGATFDVVLARDLYPSSLEGDEPEPPEVIEWPLHAVNDLLLRPDFSEARSIAAVFLVKQWLEKEKNNE